MAEIGVNISVAKDFLTNGKLVGVPTETVYGLAGNALDQKAVLAIFETKNRPAFDPLIIHTDTIEKVRGYVSELPDIALKFAEHFWPGPLTMLLPKAPIIPDLVTSGLDTVAVRIPRHPLLLNLLSELDFPLAAPSANPFGYISPTSANHVNAQLGDKIPYILNGGECEVGIESTIVGFENEQVIVYRLGGLDISEIENIVGRVAVTAVSSSNPKAPGMLKSHYAPRIPVRMMRRAEMLSLNPNGVGFLLFDHYLEGVGLSNQRVLSPRGDLREAAHNLFAFLRELDQQPIQSIVAEWAPAQGLGLAINDRLKRAAAE